MDVDAKVDTARSAEKLAADDADSDDEEVKVVEDDEEVKVVEPKPKDESKKKRQLKSSVTIAKHAETNTDEQQKQQEVESSQPKAPERRTTRSRAAKRDHDGPTQEGDDQTIATRKDKVKTDKAPWSYWVGLCSNGLEVSCCSLLYYK